MLVAGGSDSLNDRRRSRGSGVVKVVSEGVPFLRGISCECSIGDTAGFVK
jgi:hypothetical protein